MVGAVVALLMAPQSGEETRQLIKERGIELRDSTQESLEAAIARAEAAAADARARAAELASAARHQADELRSRGQEVLEEQRARIENVIEAAKAPPKAKKASTGGSATGDKKS
jgi:gas vesicle protein